MKTLYAVMLFAAAAACAKPDELPGYYDMPFKSASGSELRLREFAKRPFVVLFRDDGCRECGAAIERLKNVRIVTVHVGNPEQPQPDTLLDPELKLAQILRVEATPAICLMRAGQEPLCRQDISDASIDVIRADLKEGM